MEKRFKCSGFRWGKIMPKAVCCVFIAALAVSSMACADSSSKEIMIPMHDGVNLKADLYLPEKIPAPVILVRTPYDRTGMRGAGEVRTMVQNGYAVVIQDVRGRFASQGKFTPFVNEARDGADTLAWIQKQDWCDGNLAASGGSYVGYTQWALTSEPNPALRALAPIVTTADIGKLVYRDGAFSLLTGLSWGVGVRGRDSDPTAYITANRGFKVLPLTKGDDKSKEDVPFYDDWTTNPYPGPFWVPLSHGHDWDKKPPAFMVAGWFDLFLGPQLDDFQNLTRNGDPKTSMRSRIVIGPWDHSFNNNPLSSEVDFGPESKWDMIPEMVEWYDFWLKGKDNGADKRPRLRLFVMGVNKWRDENEWPLARTLFTPYYFSLSGEPGSLKGRIQVEAPGREPPDKYVYDPSNPSPSRGGTVLGINMGPRDIAADEGRQDLLIFTSEPLSAPLEITGPLKVVVWAETTACDTDFVARLLDITPEGKSIVYAEGIQRASFRDPGSAPEAIEPGKIYKYEINLWATSLVFATGHKIRVHVTSSNFPHWDRSLNECSFKFGMVSKFNKAAQTIYHDGEHPSHILLPVIPEEK